MMISRLLSRAEYRRQRHAYLLSPFAALGKFVGMTLRTVSLEAILFGQAGWAANGVNDSLRFGIIGIVPAAVGDDRNDEYRRCWSLSRGRTQERIAT